MDRPPESKTHEQAANALETSPLFSKTPISEGAGDPVVVVGLPRSGSSYLSFVLSRIKSWYVFDDLYLMRKAKGIGAASGPLSQRHLAELVDFLCWQVRARIKWVSFEPPRCSLDDVDHLEEALLETFAGRQVLWHELMREWLVRLARHHGCENWGYKAPQDFMHLEELKQVFPGLRVIFIYRDPRATMASLKFMAEKEGEKDGKRGQYHPVAYSLYWRDASETMIRYTSQEPERVCTVKFEELVSAPNREAERLARFLNSELDEDVQRSDSNTSFKSKKRKAITPTETWLCERIARSSMEALGYQKGSESPRLRDLGDLLQTSTRFLLYQIGRAVKDPAGRQSIKAFVKRRITKRGALVNR